MPDHLFELIGYTTCVPILHVIERREFFFVRVVGVHARLDAAIEP